MRISFSQPVTSPLFSNKHFGVIWHDQFQRQGTANSWKQNTKRSGRWQVTPLSPFTRQAPRIKPNWGFPKWLEAAKIWWTKEVVTFEMFVSLVWCWVLKFVYEIVSFLGGDCLDMTLEMMLPVGLSTVLQWSLWCTWPSFKKQLTGHLSADVIWFLDACLTEMEVFHLSAAMSN